MSLQAYALAICATGALIEAMPAWVSVEMEPREPLDLAETRAQVLVGVFIGDEHTAISGRRWTQGTTTIELVVQAILPPIVRAEIDGVEATFETHAGGTRPIYAVIHEGLRRAFTAPDPDTWAELLQAVFTMHPEPVTGMPGKAERPGQPGKPPMPVIDYSIPCGVIMPPRYGEPLSAPWDLIVAKMRADDAFTAPEADFFEALLRGPTLTDLQAELALAGLSRIEGAALGLGAFQGVEPAATLGEVIVDLSNGLTPTDEGDVP